MPSDNNKSAVSPLMTVREAAQICDTCERHITRMCTVGEIKAVKLGRIWRIDRAAFMAKLGLN
jgi:excisionase family DNA binding protein